VTPFPSQSSLVVTARDGARSCHPTTILLHPPADGWQLPIAQARGHQQHRRAHCRVFLGGGYKAALAEET
jgi:hypothetical protein